jgi:hypothetical protein
MASRRVSRRGFADLAFELDDALTRSLDLFDERDGLLATQV